MRVNTFELNKRYTDGETDGRTNKNVCGHDGRHDMGKKEAIVTYRTWCRDERRNECSHRSISFHHDDCSAARAS